MKNQFADYKTSKELKELGLLMDCIRYYINPSDKLYYHGIKNESFGHPLQDIIDAPIWQQVKEWLWEKNKVWISINRQRTKGKTGYYYIIHIENDTAITDEEKIKLSPIIAEIEAIKKAIQYLWEDKFGKNV